MTGIEMKAGGLRRPSARDPQLAWDRVGTDSGICNQRATSAGEASLPPDHFHPKLLESLHRVVWSNRVDDRAQMRVDTLKIDQRFRADSERFRIANHLRCLGGGQQRFGGHVG